MASFFFRLANFRQEISLAFSEKFWINVQWLITVLEDWERSCKKASLQLSVKEDCRASLGRRSIYTVLEMSDEYFIQKKFYGFRKNLENIGEWIWFRLWNLWKRWKEFDFFFFLETFKVVKILGDFFIFNKNLGNVAEFLWINWVLTLESLKKLKILQIIDKNWIFFWKYSKLTRF